MTTANPSGGGPYSDIDIFDIYECLRNDKEQKRFINVLDFVRQTVMNTIGQSSDQSHPYPSAAAYLSAISFLILEQIHQKKTDGLAELLKLFHVAIQATNSLDSSIAAQLTELLPLFQSEAGNTELLIHLCPALCDLTAHTSFNQAMVDQLVVGLVNGTLSDNSHLRNSAAKAIYATPVIIPAVFTTSIQKLDENPLRALTVIGNIVSYITSSDWVSNAQLFIDLCDSPNRAVRAKALHLVAHGLHYFPPETVINIVKKFTATVPSAPGDVLFALAELIQSSITMLAHADALALASNFPSFVKRLLDFFSLEDKEAENLIYSVFLYGIHALLAAEIDPVSKGASVQATIEEITSALGAISVNIWPQLYQILTTLPDKIHALTDTLSPEILVEIHSRVHPESPPPSPPENNDEKPLYFLEGPINATFGKLQDLEVANHEGMVGFLVAVAESVGLGPFFGTFFSANDEDPFHNQLIFDAILIPVLSTYRSNKHPSDLEWTVSRLLQSGFEMELFAAAVDDEPRRLWFNLWNAIPNGVTAQSDVDLNQIMVHDDEDKSLLDFIESRLTWPSARESFLLRPIAKIVAKLAPQFLNSGTDFFKLLLDISVAQNCSAVILPAFEALASAMDPAVANDKFTSLMADEILQLGQDPETIQQACSMVDVALCLLPFLSDNTRLQLYRILLSFITKPNQFQKKGFRAMRQLLNQYGGMEGINLEELKETLSQTATGENRSSSAVRYRLNLMVTILEHAGDYYEELLSSFLPEFVAALKESGAKTRAAGNEGLQMIAASCVGDPKKMNGVISALVLGLGATAPGIVSSTIEAADTVVGRYYDKIDPEMIVALCEVIWKGAQANAGSAEVLRSATKFAKTLVKKLKRTVKDSQLPMLLQLGAACAKSSNWDIEKKGRKLIARCIEAFDEEAVAAAFPEGDERLLRGIRKERRREARDKGGEKRVETIGMEEGFSFDPNDGDVDLQDPSTSVSRRKVAQVNEKGEEYEYDGEGRLVLREAPREEKKKKMAKVVEDDDEDGGNEVAMQIRNRRQKAEEKRKRDTGAFVAGGLPPAHGRGGRGGRNNHRGGPDFKIAPLSSKTVNKRYKGQMKAAYKQLFKTGQ